MSKCQGLNTENLLETMPILFLQEWNIFIDTGHSLKQAVLVRHIHDWYVLIEAGVSGLSQ
jgi:hypothetical protein